MGEMRYYERFIPSEHYRKTVELGTLFSGKRDTSIELNLEVRLTVAIRDRYTFGVYAATENVDKAFAEIFIEENRVYGTQITTRGAAKEAYDSLKRKIDKEKYQITFHPHGGHEFILL